MLGLTDANGMSISCGSRSQAEDLKAWVHGFPTKIYGE
jgi:hypothetical protein